MTDRVDMETGEIPRSRVAVDPEFHALLNPLTEEEYTQLEASLLAEGCRDALVTWNGTLIDGHNRLEICQRRNLPYAVIDREFESREAVIDWICANQNGRRNQTPYARAEAALRRKAAIAAKAKARQIRKSGNSVVQNSAQQNSAQGKTREELAEAAGVSHDTIHKVETIQQSAPGALLESTRAGDVSVHRAYELTKRYLALPDDQRAAAASLCGDSTEKADTLVRLHTSAGSPESNGTYSEIIATGGFHFGDDMEDWCDFLDRSTREIDAALRSIAKHHAREESEARREEKRQRAQALPPDLYNVIYVDPPWQYDNTGLTGAAESHYDTMEAEDIYTLPERIGLCIHADAILFLWVTNAHLEAGLECVRRWGFAYKSNAAWVKTDLIKSGMGWYLRGRHELLLIATRGSFTPLDEHISPPIGSVIVAPIREHSRKPDEVYTIIERLYPGCNYVELFARGAGRPGWAVWGDQAGG